jgi:anti-anti-sigma factor
MDIEVKKLKRVTVLEIQGRIDSATADEFENQLSAVIEAGKTNVILDLSAVDFLASAGLRVMVTAHKTLQSYGGQLCIAAPSSQVVETLDITGLNAIFTTYEDREIAIGSF